MKIKAYLIELGWAIALMALIGLLTSGMFRVMDVIADCCG